MENAILTQSVRLIKVTHPFSDGDDDEEEEVVVEVIVKDNHHDYLMMIAIRTISISKQGKDRRNDADLLSGVGVARGNSFSVQIVLR